MWKYVSCIPRKKIIPKNNYNYHCFCCLILKCIDIFHYNFENEWKHCTVCFFFHLRSMPKDEYSIHIDIRYRYRILTQLRVHQSPWFKTGCRQRLTLGLIDNIGAQPFAFGETLIIICELSISLLSPLSSLLSHKVSSVSSKKRKCIGLSKLVDLKF